MREATSETYGPRVYLLSYKFPIYFVSQSLLTLLYCITLSSSRENQRSAQEVACPKGGTTHQGAPGPPGAPRWVVPTSVASHTPSLHYKFPNIPKPFGVALDQKFRRCKVSVSVKINLDPVPAPCRRGESSPMAIFVISAATTMRRE